MDGAMQKALAAHKDQPAGLCPDENTLAAYMEARLDPSERQRVESHASNCMSCQELIGLALRLSEPEAEIEAAAVTESSGKKVLFHFTLPVSVLAMIVVTLVGGFLFFRVLRDSTRFPAAPQTAELHSPAKVEGVSVARSPAASLPKEKAASPEQRAAASAPELHRSEGPLAPKVTARPPASEIAPPRAPALQPRPAIEPTTPAAVQMLEARAGGAADRIPVSETKASENRPPGEAVSPGVGRMNLAAAYTEPIARAQAAAQFSPEFTPLDAVRTLARLIPSLRDELPVKKIKDRTFYFNSGYWIDGQCTEHPSSEFAEVKPDSAEHGQMMKSLPDLIKMSPVIVYWDAKNRIIR